MKKLTGKLLTIFAAAAMLTMGAIPEAGGIFGFLTQQVFAAEPVTYVNRVWDKNEQKVISTDESISDYKFLKDADISSGGNTWIGSGNVNNPAWYVINSDYTIDNAMYISGAASIVICDGVTLTVKKGIVVNQGGDGSRNVLNIYGQQKDSGKIIATGTKYCAGIGGEDDHESGYINIYGGTIEATGGEKGAGIGGGDDCSNGKVNIYGGKISAKGGRLAAGIGGGDDGEGGSIHIYGGDISSFGGDHGAGIGGGEDKPGGFTWIHNVDHLDTGGGKEGAGIGGGQGGNSGFITIEKGELNIHGGEEGAGIGGGSGAEGRNILIKYFSGNTWGGEHAAGIGGGKGADSGLIRINGGYFGAWGGSYTSHGWKDENGRWHFDECKDGGAGIGGGYDGNGTEIRITGGTVTATGGHNAAGIGGGEKGDLKEITIEGGTVNSTGNKEGAGIGGGTGGDLISAHIKGGRIIATGGTSGAGIGGGYKGILKEFVMNDGDINANGSEGGAGVGSGLKANFNGKIEISGGKLVAETKRYKDIKSIFIVPEEYAYGSAAAIGAGCKGDFKSSGKIILNDGNIEANYIGDEIKRVRMIGAGSFGDDDMDIDGTIVIGDPLYVRIVGRFYLKPDKRIESLTKVYSGYERILIDKCQHTWGHDVFENQQYHRFYCDRCKFSELRSHNQARSDWKWADDLSSASVTFYCQYCKHDYSFDSSDVTVTSEITKQPTYTEYGEKTYTASALYDGKTLTNIKRISLDKLPWAYRDSQLVSVNNIGVPGDSEAAGALIKAARSAIEGASYDADKTETENNAVIDGIVTKLTKDLALQRDSDAFEAYKNEKIGDAANASQTDDSEAVKALITAAKTDIGAVSFNTAKTLAENKAAIDEICTQLDSDLTAQRNEDDFIKYKAEQMAVVSQFAKEGDSDEITALINDAKASIEALVYDQAKTPDENKAAVKEVVTQLTGTLGQKRGEETFNSYKAALKSAAEQVKTDYPTAVNILNVIDDYLPRIEELSYDTGRTFEENIASVETLINEIDSALDLAENKDELEAYKTERKAYADSLSQPGDSDEVIGLITNAKADIDKITYDENKSLDGNKDAVDKCITKLTADLTPIRDGESFKAYKTTQKAVADALKESGDSEAIDALITASKASIDACDYDNTRSLSSNRLAIDEILNKLNDDLIMQRKIDALEAYKTTQKAAADALEKADMSEGSKALIAAAKSSIDSISYAETRSPDENKAFVDEVITQLKADLATRSDIDDFAAYRTARKAEIDALITSGDSMETIQLITDASDAADALTYDEEKTLEKNKEAVDEIVTKLNADLVPQRQKDAYENYRIEQKKTVDELEYMYMCDDARSMISSARSEIDELAYEGTKTLDENKAEIDKIVTKLKAELEEHKTEDGFKENVDLLIKSAKEYSENTEYSEQIRAIFTEAVTKLQAVHYDSSKTYEENIVVLKAVVNEIDAELDKLMYKESFEEYKTKQKEAAEALYNPLGGDAALKLITDAKAAIDAVSYDESRSLDENKAAVEAVIEKLKNDIDACMAEVKLTVTFDTRGGSEIAPMTVNYGSSFTAPAVTKIGYKFEEWTLGDRMYDFSQPVTDNITLTAVWTPVKYTVTFYVNGTKHSEQQVEYGKLVELPTVEVKEGYTLYGWMTDPEMKDNFNLSDPVAGPLTLYAQERVLSDVLLNGEKANSLAEALLAKSGKYSLIGINKDQTGLKKMTFAKAADTALIGIEGNSKTLAFEGAANIKPNQTFILSELTLTAEKGGKAQNVTITSAAGDGGGLLLDEMKIKGKKATVNASKGDLILSDVSADCQLDVKGSSKTVLGAFGEVEADNITGFGLIELKGKLIVKKKLVANKINFNEGAELIIMKGATVSIKKGISGYGTVHLNDGYKSFDIKGSADGNIKITADNKFADKQLIIKSSLKDLDKAFDISGIVPEVTDGSYDYGLYTKSGKVYVRAYKMKLDGTKYCEWGDIVKDINSKKAKNATYAVELLSDVDPGSTFKLPGKGKYAGLTIYGKGHTLMFPASSLGLTGNLKLSDVTFKSSAKKSCTIKLNKFSFDHADATLINCTEK